MQTYSSYTLEPYNGISSRYRCPYCQHKDRKFSRYINVETGQYLADHVGRCERIESCGKHYKPRQYFEENGQLIMHDSSTSKTYDQKKQQTPKPVSYVPVDAFKSTLPDFTSNQLINFLHSKFSVEITNQLISRYFIGTTHKPWHGATVFWQIDIRGGVRAGKIMLYDPLTGKRIKEPFSYVSHMHKTLELTNFNLKQCFYGEHLLDDKSKPVAIVESEKTAIIASVYLPQLIWLATGGKNGCSWTDKAVCQVLQGRAVILYPDLSKPDAKVNCFQNWSEKAEQLRSFGIKVQVSTLLEDKASTEERREGLDLADYLLKFKPPQPTVKEPALTEMLAPARIMKLPEPYSTPHV